MSDDIIHCRTHGWTAEVKSILDRVSDLVDVIGDPTDYFRHWLVDHADAKDRRQHLTGSIDGAVRALRALEAGALARQFTAD